MHQWHPVSFLVGPLYRFDKETLQHLAGQQEGAGTGVAAAAVEALRPLAGEGEGGRPAPFICSSQQASSAVPTPRPRHHRQQVQKGGVVPKEVPPQPAGDLAALPGSHRPPQGRRHFQFLPFDVPVTGGERGAFPSRYASCGRREKGRGPPTCPPRLPCARSPQMSSARRNCSAIWMTVTRPRPGKVFLPSRRPSPAPASAMS